MSGLFSKPKTPSVPEPKEDEGARAAAEVRRRRQSAKGYQSTILSDMRNAGLRQTLGS